MPTTTEQSLLPLFVLQEHTDAVLCCRFYPSEVYQRDESSWFLSGDAGGLVVLWNLATRRKIISFSALTEAHRQLCGISPHGRDHGTRTAGGCAPGKEALSEYAGARVFGPHSQSILSVGFIPLSLSSPQPTTATDSSREVVDGLVRGVDAEVSSSAVRPPIPDPAARGTSNWTQPERQRFRISRRTPSRPISSEEAPSLSMGDILDSGTPRFAFTPLSTICFYTHCRDQRVYIWCLKRQRNDASASSTTRVPQLIAVLTAPQHGFCPVESISKAASTFARTYLAVPHESGGEVTVWELSWRQPSDANFTSSRELKEKGTSVEPGSSSGSGDAYVEEEKTRTSEMSPMDALIARAAAEERRVAKMKQESTKVSGETAIDYPSPSAAISDSVISRGERASVLCYVDPTATTASSNFSIRRLCTFSTCPKFKGGTIMRLTMCHDAQHLTVAFESGHIVLARYRNEDAIDIADHSGNACHTGRSLPDAQVRNVTRAFAESALACWWSGRRMLACSSEGGIHCYDMSVTAGGLLEAQLVWGVTLRKGIGSVFLQRNLVVAGCWDSTLRLYDARDGRLVSVLTYQRETINEVRMAPSSIARVAAFGFDMRQPRLYAGLPGALCRNIRGCIASNSTAVTQGNLSQFSESPLCETDFSGTPTPNSSSESLAAEEQLVYLFASASKDCTVALWRVDLGLVVEQAARKAITA